MKLSVSLVAIAAVFGALAAPVSAQDVPPPAPQQLTVPPGYSAVPEPDPEPPPQHPYAQPSGQHPHGQQPYAQQPYAQQPYAQPTYAPAGQPLVVQLSQPTRHGFTLELGLGIAWLRATSSDFSELGLHGLTISLGGFVTPSLAIEARVTSATILGRGGSDSITFTNILVNLQYWANDWLTIGGGIGAGMGSGTSLVTDFGFALNARLGAAFLRWRTGLMRVALEFVPAWIESELVTMTAIALEYQYY